MSRYRSIQKAMSERGARISSSAAGHIGTFRHPDVQWLVRVSMPFAYSASKNHVWTSKDRDHVRSRARSNAYRAELARLVRDALHGRHIATNKLWIDILVQKPDHKGDAVNVVDLVCDAVKDATRLDDRWYSLRAVDWQIVKAEGRLFVGVSQEECWNGQACASCGRILPLEEFARNRSNRRGVNRNCNECRTGK